MFGHEESFVVVASKTLERPPCSVNGWLSTDDVCRIIGHSRCSVSKPIEGQRVTASVCHSMPSKPSYVSYGYRKSTKFGESSASIDAGCR